MNSKPFLAVISVLATTILLASCGGGGDGTSPPSPVPPPPVVAEMGTVAGLVVSSAGTAISGATIRAGSATATSAADGSYTLTTGVGERIVIRAEAAGFADTFQVARLAAGQTAFLGALLLPAGVTSPVNVATGGTVMVPNSSAQITIPAGGLVPVIGGAVAATVNVSVIPISLNDDIHALPGDYTAVTAGGGAPFPIESFGALRVDIRDSNGVRYNLATGRTSIIRIPVSALSAAAPAAIPLFFFNESTGRWVQEGTAALAGLASNQYYEGTVTHFSFWSANRATDTVFVSGCVRDAANQPVANAAVEAMGANYSWASSTFTAMDGGFRVAVRRADLVGIDVLFDRNGRLLTLAAPADTAYVGPLSADFTLPSCLVTMPAPFGIFTSATSSLPAGMVGAAYSATLAAFSGTRPYSSWSVSAGTLPAGLTLAGATGQISGTPTTAGTFNVTIQARDSSTPPQLATEPLSITILPVSPVPPVPPSGAGTLTVANAPVSVGGTFVANFLGASSTGVSWGEGIGAINGEIGELILVNFDAAANRVVAVLFWRVESSTVLAVWACSANTPVPCAGVTLNRSAGTVTFVNAALAAEASNPLSSSSITVNGMLAFTPF